MAAEFGGRQMLDAAMEAAAKERKTPKSKPTPKVKKMDRATAERLASDAEQYDSRIKGGRLT